MMWTRFGTRSQKESTLSSQTTKCDSNGIMTILHAFQHHSNSHWRRAVLSYIRFTGSGTGSSRLIFATDDRMRSVRLENKCESSYRSEGYTAGSQGHVYIYSQLTARKLWSLSFEYVCLCVGRRQYSRRIYTANIWNLKVWSRS
jgi:hypothetical protein